VEYCKNHNDVRLDSEVDRIRKATEESAPNSSVEILISQRVLNDPIVCVA